MSLFSKAPINDNPDEKQGIIEIEAHKDAKTEAIKEAKEATRQLNKLLVDNGFTLKIYLATGGKHPRKT